MSQAKGRGRPRGAKNIKEYAEVVPSRCSRCGSSRRGPYHNSSYQDFRGQGLEFVGMFYRPCKCLECGQSRIDKQPDYRGMKAESLSSVLVPEVQGETPPG